MAEGRINLALPTSPRSATEVDKGSLLQNAFVEDESGNKLAVKRAGLEVGMEASTTGLHRGIWFDSEKDRFVFVNGGFTLSPVHFSSLKPWNPVKTYPPASVVEGPLKTPGGSKGKPLPDGDWEDGRDPNLVFTCRINEIRDQETWKWYRGDFDLEPVWHSVGNDGDDIVSFGTVAQNADFAESENANIEITMGVHTFNSNPAQNALGLRFNQGEVNIIIYTRDKSGPVTFITKTYPLFRWEHYTETPYDFPLVETAPSVNDGTAYTPSGIELNIGSVIEIFRSGNIFSLHIDGTYIRSQTVVGTYPYSVSEEKAESYLLSDVVFGNTRVV